MRLFHEQIGFTLLEVMVALTILSVVAISASQASRSYLHSVVNMKTRTLANYVAENTISELQMQKAWLESQSTKQVQAQGREWQVVVEPNQDIKIKTLQHIRVRVSPVEEGQVKNTIVTVDSVLMKSKENP